MARTAPSEDMTTIAASALDPSRTLVAKIRSSASSAAVCMRWSKVVRITTSSVVSRVKKSGPVVITQSAKAPPARACAASESVAGRACARSASASDSRPCSRISRSTVAARSWLRLRSLVGA